jgi:hypothetical protein
MLKKYLFVTFVSLFFFSCTNIQKVDRSISFEEKGLVGNLSDLKIKNKNIEIVVGKNFNGSSLKITNLDNKKSMNLFKIKKIKSLDKSRIAYVNDSVVNQLEINTQFPFVKIESIKQNRTFVANKAKIFQEEKRLKNTSKVYSVEVISLGKKKLSKKKIKKKTLFIQYGSFYYSNYAKELRDNLKKFLPTKNIAIKGKVGNYLVTIGPIKNLEEYDLIFKELNFNKFDGYEIIIK